MASKWLEFFILTSLLCGFVLTTDSTFCDNRAEGYYPDETDCTYYYQCDQYNNMYHRPCSPGLVWSDALKSCTHGPCQTHPTPPSSLITTIPPNSITTVQPMDSPNPNGTMFLLSVKDLVPVQPSFLSLYSVSTSDCALYCFSYSVCIGFSVYQQTCDLFKPPTDPNNTMTTLSGSETWCKFPCYKL